MATERFAIPLNSQSIQPGEITFQQVKDNASSAQFVLNNCTVQASDQLDLKTSNGGIIIHHTFGVTGTSTATAYLSTSQINAVLADTNHTDWDFVEAEWTMGKCDDPEASNMTIVQGGQVYNKNGWPPQSS